MKSAPTTRILFLAPQPFFSERGTPIAVFLAASAVASRPQTHVDLLTLKGPRAINVTGAKQHTVKLPAFFGNIPPGISLKKILADVFFFFATFRLIFTQPRYDLIHAVEEAGFIALLLSKLFKIPYVYDMDSQLSTQVCQRWRWLAPLAWLLAWLEGLVIRSACSVIAVCPAIVDVARRCGAKNIYLLQDVSLLEQSELFVVDSSSSAMTSSSQDASTIAQRNHIRVECGLSQQSVLILYVGNLEVYQGVDLLISSMAELHQDHHLAHLAIVGGSPEQISSYRAKCEKLGLNTRVSFLGPRPLGELGQLLSQADIVVSPRIEGINTPMKIYSYLHSGRALLATRLETHTQVLNDQIAWLAPPDTSGFAAALAQLVSDPRLRDQLGSAAKQFADQNCTWAAFLQTINQHYDSITASLKVLQLQVRQPEPHQV